MLPTLLKKFSDLPNQMLFLSKNWLWLFSIIQIEETWDCDFDKFCFIFQPLALPVTTTWGEWSVFFLRTQQKDLSRDLNCQPSDYETYNSTIF